MAGDVAQQAVRDNWKALDTAIKAIAVCQELTQLHLQCDDSYTDHVAIVPPALMERAREVMAEVKVESA